MICLTERTCHLNPQGWDGRVVSAWMTINSKQKSERGHFGFGRRRCNLQRYHARRRIGLAVKRQIL